MTDGKGEAAPAVGLTELHISADENPEDSPDSPRTERRRSREPRHPWTPTSRPTVHSFSLSSSQSVASTSIQSRTEASTEPSKYKWTKESQHAPYAERYLTKGYPRQRHMQVNSSKIACDLIDARTPPFAAQHTLQHLAMETMSYRRGACEVQPGSFTHTEWNERQLPLDWSAM